MARKKIGEGEKETGFNNLGDDFNIIENIQRSGDVIPEGKTYYKLNPKILDEISKLRTNNRLAIPRRENNFGIQHYLVEANKVLRENGHEEIDMETFIKWVDEALYKNQNATYLPKSS